MEKQLIEVLLAERQVAECQREDTSITYGRRTRRVPARVDVVVALERASMALSLFFILDCCGLILNSPPHKAC